jgi:hypothetical protein
MALRNFVVQLPGSNTNKLVSVPSSSTVKQIRVAAGIPAAAGTLCFAGQLVDDSAPALRFPELGTFSVVPPPPVPPRVSSAPQHSSSPFVVECSICLESLSSETVPCVNLPCTHRFHAVCVREWASHSSCCPLCRREMSPPGTGLGGPPGKAAPPLYSAAPPPS